MYAYWPDRARAEEHMAQTGGLKRKSFFVEERTLKRAKKALAKLS
jgi:hypothetical protein